MVKATDDQVATSERPEGLSSRPSSDEERLQFFISDRCAVSHEMCDDLGHMNIQFHARIFSNGAFALMSKLGLRHDSVSDRRLALVAARMEVDYASEARLGATLTCYSAVSEANDKKIDFFHRIIDESDGRLVSKARVLSICVDLATRRSCSIPADVCLAATRMNLA
jgi:acyl-CoA thioesterase FadM